MIQDETPWFAPMKGRGLKAMSPRIIPRDSVAQHLSVSTQVLLRYERMGLVRAIQVGDVQGYEPAEVRRIWSIVTYQRDLGINLAGVEVILQLREQMTTLHHQLSNLANELRNLVDEPGAADKPR